jgi:type IV secretory pathway VirB4 component
MSLPIWNKNKIYFNNKILPNNFRMLIVGSSGCGKNVLLMKMLLKDGFIDYNNLIM